MIPEGFITSLLDRADIVDVVGRYVTLKKGGRNFMACCPFHKEKTPSFSVSPSKQIFKCFGCGKAGNAIGFLMDIERLDFPDAVRRLAEIYGMEVPEDRTPGRQEARKKARALSDFMKEAADYYTSCLRNSTKAIDYLKAREITGETAERFGLGYSPDGWHGLEAVFPGDRYKAQELLTTGLVLEKNGRRYDAFRDRIMFPIRSPKGTVIGFGARTMKGDEQPKYLNSPETPIYHKGSELYGLYEGRAAIVEKGRAIVCEGYMDVIQLSQAGFREAVAALGTSITPEHVKKLFKLSDSVYFSFDGDSAGRKAAKRALDAALPVIGDDQSAHFVLLPPEHDPDSLIKAKGPEAYEREMEKSLPLTVFLKSILVEGKELIYAEERAKLVKQAKPLILSMKSAPVLKLSLMKEIAALARLQLEDLEREWGVATERKTVERPSFEAAPRAGGPYTGRFGSWDARFDWRRRPAPEPRIGVQDVRDRMLQCFLAYPQLLGEFSAQIEDEFVMSPSPAANRIVEVWRAAAGEEDGEPMSPAALLMRLSESSDAARYESLLAGELTLDTPEEGARLELRRAFLELELERVKARELVLGSSGAAIEELRRLKCRRTELMKLIAKAVEDERIYRREQEDVSRTRDFAKNELGEGATTLSDNPKVRAIQELLFGKMRVGKADAKKIPAAEPAAETPATSASPFGAPPSPFGKPPAPSTSSGASPFGAPPAVQTPQMSPFGTPPAATPSMQARTDVSSQPAHAEAAVDSPRSRRDAIARALREQAEKRAGMKLEDPDQVFPEDSGAFAVDGNEAMPPEMPEGFGDGMADEEFSGLLEEAQENLPGDVPDADPDMRGRTGF